MRDWGADWSSSLAHHLQSLGPADVCVLHMGGHEVLARLHYEAAGTRVVVVFHGANVGDWHASVSEAELSVVLRRETADLLRDLGARPGQIAMLQPSVNRKLFRPPTREASLRVTETLGFVGRVDASKGAFEIPEAIRQARAAGHLVQAELVGPCSRSQRMRIRAACEAAGVEPFVRVLGTLTSAGVAERMRTWRLLLAPSHSEGYGIVVLEACASGLPIAAVSGVFGADLVDRAGVETAERARYAELVVRMLEHQRHPVSSDWIPDHDDAARKWDEILGDLPEWSPKSIPSYPWLSRLANIRPIRTRLRPLLLVGRRLRRMI